MIRFDFRIRPKFGMNLYRKGFFVINQLLIPQKNSGSWRYGFALLSMGLIGVSFSCSKKDASSSQPTTQTSSQDRKEKTRIPNSLSPKDVLKEQGAKSMMTTEQTLQSFLGEMKAEQFTPAYNRLGSELKKKLSFDQMNAVWQQQVSLIGKLSSWNLVHKEQMQGKEIYWLSLKFERGEILSRFGIEPKTQEIEGFFLKKPFQYSSRASYVDPTLFREENIFIGKEPFILGGTLTVPMGTGPFPAVVLVHGSGRQDRDETIGEDKDFIGRNKIFKDLAEGLSSHGIAVLRYDKRTWFYGDRMTKATADDEVVFDAVSAVSFLKGRADINPKQIVIIGHSLGALFAPEIAVRCTTATPDVPIAGVALLAPPGRKPWDAVLQQQHYLLPLAKKAAEAEIAKLPDPKRKEATEEFEKQLQNVENQLVELEKQAIPLKTGKPEDGIFWSVPYSYWRDVASRDGVAMVKKLHKPTLILRGDRDYQVIEEDIKIWQQGLQDILGVEITILSGLNHLFLSGTGTPGPQEYTIPGHVDAHVIERLIAFVKKAGTESM